MKSVQEDIKKQEFKNVYLFFGDEGYLKTQYRDKLLAAWNPDGDTMNVARFQDKGIDVNEVISLGDTVPFFAPRRILLLENTGWFKVSSPQMAQYLEEMPEYLYILFVEDEVDKRNKLYKNVAKYGRAVEFGVQNETTLMRWVLQILNREGRRITQRDMELFLSKTGNDMNYIEKELEKLLCYTMGRDVITTQDIENICVNQVTNQIFAMVQAVSEQNQEKALQLYYDLLSLKEPPMRILFLLARQFNQLLKIRELKDLGYDVKTIAEKAGIQSFIVKKSMLCLKHYTVGKLRQAVADCVQAEEDVKTGKLNDILSVELLIVKYASQEG